MRIFEDYIEDIEIGDMMSRNDIGQDATSFDEKSFRVKMFLSCNNPKMTDTTDSVFRKMRTILTKHGFDEINTSPIYICGYNGK